VTSESPRPRAELDRQRAAPERREVMIEVRELPLSREVISEVRELTDTEVESVCGGVIDLGKIITKAVGEAISAAIG
jgi:hypothetical protein